MTGKVNFVRVGGYDPNKAKAAKAAPKEPVHFAFGAKTLCGLELQIVRLTWKTSAVTCRECFGKLLGAKLTAMME